MESEDEDFDIQNKPLIWMIFWLYLKVVFRTEKSSQEDLVSREGSN